MRSMTGYAKLYYQDDNFDLQIEMKSVNNKNLNLRLKTPYVLNFLEIKLRTLISNYIKRGYLEVRIELENKEENLIKLDYDKKFADNYMEILNSLENDFKQTFTNKMDVLIKQSSLIKKDENDIDESKYEKLILEKLEDALKKLNQTRADEGERLKVFFIEKINLIEEKVNQIKENKEDVVNIYKEKLLERVNKIEEDINFSEEEILKEILLFADKSDISEEMTRLDSHITQFRIDLENEDVMGKKLDFILQEMFREINTTGVKCNLYDISKLVVECKNELEKMREQILNIE